jgi:hypothetical protein
MDKVHLQTNIQQIWWNRSDNIIYIHKNRDNESAHKTPYIWDNRNKTYIEPTI